MSPQLMAQEEQAPSEPEAGHHQACELPSARASDSGDEHQTNDIEAADDGANAGGEAESEVG